MKLCTVEGCSNKHQARGLCLLHYGRQKRAGNIEVSPPPLAWHRLTDKDTESRTATCSICGPVKIHRGTDYWVCRTVKKRYWEDRPTFKYGDGKRIELAESRAARTRLKVEQQDLCAICGRPAPENGKQLGLDHCHTTGQIRGLLCVPCNIGLGSFQDNPDLLRAAAEYLQAP